MPEFALPESVTVAMANLAEEAREGLLALAVGTGLQVMEAIMEEDVVALAGPKGKWNPERVATRHGTDQGQVTLGGRRMPIRRPRVRSADSTEELAVASYEHFSSTEVLGKMALERMVAKLSTRRYHAGLEPVGAGVQERARSTSKSSVSRRFVAATEKALSELMAGDLSGLDLVAVMIDGVYFAEHLCVVALGIDIQGHKWPLGVVEGSTENSTVVSDLLAGLRDRGLDTARPTLVVIDGAKALASAVRAVFDHPVIQRCQLHKLRNVQARLPDRLAATVGAKMRAAYQDPDPLVAEAALTALARDLERSHPGASGSLREGLTETLTIARLGVPPTLARTLRSTNSIESMIEICRDHAANVKRWRNGQMALRWCAAGMAEAKKQFRRVNGFMHLPALRAALDAHVGVADTPGTYDHSEEMAA
ncbi:MAG TPA: IS256 family transposase [Acidimicrobiales bacterium]|nr:IS256 family transposase [Acidimicrobiales bacterium]